MSANQKNTLLVTGASGHLGRRVLELLLETHNGTIIAATRTPEKLADFSQRGVIVHHADFEDQASLLQAFKGVDRLLLISTDALDVPGHRLNQHRNAVKAAEQAGVSHVVYTSIINPGPDSPVFVAPDHRGTEEALAATKMGWTVLRENLYMDLLLMSLAQALQTGKLVNAIGDGKAAYITREDCARAAVAALTSSFEGSRTLDITGPEAISQYEVAAIASRITGQEISYLPVELEGLIQNMVAGGLPRPLAEGYASFDAAIAQDKFSAVANTVKDLTGREPISVADFLSAHRDVLLPVAL
ncbi:MAG: SDR family oxidoreductase [Anaerolineales bacterium]|nr:SDR family oxidoreductase [Anaerolineales bacterium]